MSQETPEAVGTVWQELYAAALLELERNKLLDRIKEAEQAIATCYAGLDAARDADEAQRIADARGTCQFCGAKQMQRELQNSA